MDILDGSRNLTQQLTYELGKAIVQGKYKVDASFPTEAELSSQYNISRSVTREAVKMLTAKGLICSRPRKGIRVQPADQWNMFDSDMLNWILSAKPSLHLLKEFTQLRSAIEPEAVALAAGCARPDQVQALETALQRMESAEAGDEDALEAAIEFHTRLLEATNNRFFIQFSDFVQAALRVSIACTNQVRLTKALKVTSVAEYRAIHEYISSGEARRGRDYMRTLFDESMNSIWDAISASESAASAKGVLSL